MSHILAPVISERCNIGIMEGYFLSCLKIGRVIPISKSGKNYRRLTIDQSLLCLS